MTIRGDVLSVPQTDGGSVEEARRRLTEMLQRLQACGEDPYSVDRALADIARRVDEQVRQGHPFSEAELEPFRAVARTRLPRLILECCRLNALDREQRRRNHARIHALPTENTPEQDAQAVDRIYAASDATRIMGEYDSAVRRRDAIARLAGMSDVWWLGSALKYVEEAIGAGTSFSEELLAPIRAEAKDKLPRAIASMVESEGRSYEVTMKDHARRCARFAEVDFETACRDAVAER